MGLRARDPRLSREVAVKLLLRIPWDDLSWVRREIAVLEKVSPDEVEPHRSAGGVYVVELAHALLVGHLRTPTT